MHVPVVWEGKVILSRLLSLPQAIDLMNTPETPAVIYHSLWTPAQSTFLFIYKVFDVM